MMNSMERVKSALRHKTPDRTPVFEYYLISNDITKLVLGRPYSLIHMEECIKEKGWKEAIRQLACDILDITTFFGYDMIYLPPNPLPLTKSEHKVIEKQAVADDPVESVRQRNEIRRNCTDVDEKSMLIYELLNAEMEERGLEFPLLAPAYTHGVWTDTALMETMLLEPDVAHEHFAIATKKALARIRKFSEYDILLIGIGGDFAGNHPLISPECYRTFIVPELKKLSDEIHALEAYAVNASDGNLWSVIDDFLIATGVDGYLEIDEHAGMKLKQLKNAYGDKVTLFGNMDCGNILSFSSIKEIKQKTVECIEDGMSSGGHVFTASNAITDSVPAENYFAMVNSYRDYFKLPHLKY